MPTYRLSRTLRRALRLLTVVAVLVLTGCGQFTPPPSTPTPADIHITGTEFRFAMAQTTLAVRTPYRFVVHNAGVVIHEWVITRQDAAAHAHDDHDSAVSAIDSTEFGPGAEVRRDVTFAEPGLYEIACRLPGHYEAGMRLSVQVQ